MMKGEGTGSADTYTIPSIRSTTPCSRLHLTRNALSKSMLLIATLTSTLAPRPVHQTTLPCLRRPTDTASDDG